jgi:hypothetical protein
MLCGAPKEVFSQDLPQYQPNSRERDLAPIDILYGAYSAETLVARTFIRRIELDADRYGSRADDLMNVVRIHEYAHAVVHLGIDQQDTKDCLSRFGPEGITDWDSFRVERQQAYRNLEPEVHEFLAQAITWVSVCKRCAEIGSDSLLETFVGLEQYQPAEYILPMGAKAAALFADWPLIQTQPFGAVERRTGGTACEDGTTHVPQRDPSRRAAWRFLEGTSSQASRGGSDLNNRQLKRATSRNLGGTQRPR